MDPAISNAGLDQLIIEVEHIEPGVSRHLDGVGADPHPGARHRPGLQRHVLTHRLIEVGLNQDSPLDWSGSPASFRSA